MRIYNWKKSIEKYLEYRGERTVIVWGNDAFSEEIMQTVKHMGIPYKGFRNEEIRNDTGDMVDFLKVGDKKSFFVLAAVLKGHKEIYQKLVSLGFELTKDFAIMGIGGYTDLLNSIDSLLTLNRVSETIPGFKIWGNDLNTYKIVVLGNSTSDPTTGNIKCWSELLYEKLMEKNYPIQVFCGAITGYSSTQEFLKLNRDVLNLNPNLVISFSGFNDVEGNSTVEKFPFLHKYQKKFYDFLQTNPRLAPDSMYVRNVSNVTHGIPCLKKDFEIWVDNMRKMHAVCSEFHIDFVAFLQPMVEFMGPEKSPEQERIIEEFYGDVDYTEVIRTETEFCSGAKNEIYQYDYIIDLSDMFQDDENVFYDTCHCNEKGNQKIADMIYKNIIKYVAYK